MKINKTLDEMNQEEEEEFLHKFEQSDDSAAREHLAAGRPIVYRESDTPPSHIIKEYPNGNRELIRMEKGVEIIVSDLPTANKIR